MLESFSSADVLSGVFALALLARLVVQLWLATRQMRHVARHRGAVPAPFAARVSLPAHQRAADYTMAQLRLGLVESAFGAAVLLGWTLLGGLSALNGGLWQLLGEGAAAWAQPLALLVAFALIGGLLELPFSWYTTFGLEQRFGFNKMTPRLWLSDVLKQTLMGALLGLPLAALVLWLMGAAGPGWWLWVWAAWMGFNLLLMWIYPSWIAPWFNQFKPLDDAALAERVGALMARCGFRARGLFVMNGSRRSAHANAYFTGLGTAKRVVFYDTLLAQLTPPEVEAVLAHELGHFRHRHLLKRIALMAALSLGVLALLGWLVQQPWFFWGLGVAPNLPPALLGAVAVPNDALALLLLALVAPVFGFWLAPWLAGWSRRHEFQADAFARAHASGADLQSALLKLYQDNASTLTPDPLYTRFYASHPPASERLARLAAP